MKNKVYFIILIVMITGCSSYPNGTAKPGELSLSVSNQNLEEWQVQFKEQLLNKLNLSSNTFADIQNSSPDFNIIPLNSNHPKAKAFRTNQYLIQNNKPNTLMNSQCENYIDWDWDKYGAPPKYYYSNPVQNDTIYMELNVCGYDKTVLVYLIEYQGYITNNSTIDSLSKRDALLFVTKHDKLSQEDQISNSLKYDEDYLDTIDRSITIHLHGHSSSAEESIFGHNYDSHNLFSREDEVVLAPNLRGFPTGHNNYTNDVRNADESYMGLSVADTVIALNLLKTPQIQSLIESKLHLLYPQKYAYTIQGTSLGAHVALVAGALEERFDAILNHSFYFPYELVNSGAHHECSKIDDILDIGNIFDVVLLIHPRFLHIYIGNQDELVNNYTYSAINSLISTQLEHNLPICYYVPNTTRLPVPDEYREGPAVYDFYPLQEEELYPATHCQTVITPIDWPGFEHGSYNVNDALNFFYRATPIND